MKIEDIAKIAGVSKSTVSLALNNRPGVNEQTKEKIIKIATENNYIPLRKTRNDNILKLILLVVIDGVIITEDYFKLPFFNELLGNLSSQAALLQYNYSTEVVNKSTFKNTIDKYSQSDLDGVIILGTNLQKRELMYADKKFNNLVVLDSIFLDLDINFVGINNFLGSYTAANYLISAGHTDIGYIMGEERIKNFDQRYDGFLKGINDFNSNINIPIFNLPSMQSNSIDSNSKKQLINYLKNITAIFCENDHMAINIMQALKEENINVPNDISIIGFDDINVAAAIRPQLTTLSVSNFDLASSALNMLFENKKNHNPISRQILINPKIVIRDSVINMS